MPIRFSKAMLFGCCAAVICMLFLSFSGNSVPAETRAKKAVFAIESTLYESIKDDTVQTSAPFVSGGIGYVPLASAAESLGGHTDGADVTVFGHTVPIQNLACIAQGGETFVEITSFCETFSLCFQNYGNIFTFSDMPLDLSAEERDALAASLDSRKYTDRALTAPVPEYTVNPYVKYTYDDLLADIAELEKLYPELVSSFTAGYSVEGREIPAFTLGRGERVIFYGACIHAGEYITTNIIMYMADRYAYGYYTVEQVEGYISYRELLDNVTFYIVPQINPDGVNIAQNGYYASTLPVASYDRQGVSWPGAYKANANGVDLNRNFPYNWDPMAENGITWRCMRYFCGFEAASEPETKMLIYLGENIPFEMFADFHKFGEVLFWVDSDSTDHLERYGSIAERILDDLKYEDKGIETIDHFGGYLSNYMRNTYDRLSMTVETCEFWSLPESQFDSINRNVYRIGLVMGEELLALDDEVEGLRALVNGKTLPFIGRNSMSDSYISPDQLVEIVKACGGEAAWDEDGTVSVSFIGCASETAQAREMPPGGSLFAMDSERRSVNVTLLLSKVGIGAQLSGATVNVTYFH